MDLASAVRLSVPGLRVSGSSPDLLAAARDLWPRALVDIQSGELPTNRPGAVVWPEHAEQITRLLELSRSEGFRVVPFGAGSGVCGAVLPDERTIVIDSKRLLDFRIDHEAPVVHAGAGVLGLTLEQELGKAGYTAGHFPSSIVCSTVGGWVAARGAGQCSSRYGKIEDMVAGLDCVLGTGDQVTMQRRRTNPDLVPLVTGSEGTLGFITRVTLRLHPAPRVRRFLAYSCVSIESGFDILRTLMQTGLRPEVARLYDPIDSVLLGQSSDTKKSPKSRNPAVGRWFSLAARQALRKPRWLQRAIEALEGNVLGGATLLLIFEGDAEEANQDAERAAAICGRAAARSLGEGPARRWLSHRYSVSFRQSPAFRLGAFTDTMEVAAPWSKLEAVYESVRRELSEHALVMAHLSHAYPDGCSIYFTFSALGAVGGNARERYEAAWRAGLGAALSAGANLSHHHGVGRSKAARLAAELGQGTELLSRLRAAWDPSGIFNPGALEAPSGDVGEVPRGNRPSFELDEISQLAEVDARLSLGAVEASLTGSSLSLGLGEEAPWSLSVADWIALGLPHAPDPWQDPVGSRIAGFEATVGGIQARVRATPRRATGPDLLSLFVGTHGRIGVIDRAQLVLAKRGASLPRTQPFRWDRDPPLSAAEQRAFELAERALRGS
ncbi:MAG TPA: FAD-binding oxidoreductase [Polyangiaceae bacterium]|nr:FAD-binding oxidoreductase [Polyangiaceae bacterium]